MGGPFKRDPEEAFRRHSLILKERKLMEELKDKGHSQSEASEIVRKKMRKDYRYHMHSLLWEFVTTVGNGDEPDRELLEHTAEVIRNAFDGWTKEDPLWLREFVGRPRGVRTHDPKKLAADCYELQGKGLGKMESYSTVSERSGADLRTVRRACKAYPKSDVTVDKKSR